jgi:hypothetical protein
MLLVVHKGALSILSSADLDEVMRFVDDVPVRGAEWSRRGDTILVRQPTDPQWFWSSDTFGDHNSVVRLENWQVGPPIVTAWTRPDAEQPHTAGATASSTRILTVLRTAKQSLDAPNSSPPQLRQSMHRFWSLLPGYMTSATPPDCATLDSIRSTAPVTYRPSAGRRRSATSWPTTPEHALSLKFSTSIESLRRIRSHRTLCPTP